MSFCVKDNTLLNVVEKGNKILMKCKFCSSEYELDSHIIMRKEYRKNEDMVKRKCSMIDDTYPVILCKCGEMRRWFLDEKMRRVVVCEKCGGK